MANTINNTTDAELTRSLLDGSIEGAFEDDTITTLTRDGLFYGCNALTDVILPNVTSMSGYSFVPSSGSASCTSLETIDAPNLATFSNTLFHLPALKYFNAPNLTTHSSLSFSIFQYCNAIEKVNLPKLTRYRSISNTSLKYVVLPSIIDFCTVRGSSNLVSLDLGKTCTNLNVGGDHIFYQTYADNIEAFIVRSETLLPLTRLLHTDVPASHQFGKFTKNKIYVPEALVEDYKVATNWSNYADIILPIEGSKYEHYWADGTPLYMSNTSGLIAYYDVGNADDWDSETKTIASRVENEFVAYKCSNQYTDINYNNPSAIPTVFYDQYANCGLGIYFGQKMSNITDVITLEFVAASTNSDCGINIFTSNNNTAGAQLIGYVSSSPSMRSFRHIVIIIDNINGFKVYVDNILKTTNKNATGKLDSGTTLRIVGTSNQYTGHVSVWNRALTQEEITEHYQYYVDNFHVGETAFDSSGNFIAE